MAIKTSLGERAFNAFNVLLLLLVTATILLPLSHILFASLSDPVRVMKSEGLILYPLEFTFDAYKAVSKNPNILSGYCNTLFIVIVGTGLNLVLTLLAAYVLSRKDLLWRGPLTMMVVFTMYFSGGMIPFYLTVRTVGLDGTLWALIIPAAINTYNLIIMRTSMAAVPESMAESATMDGASHLRVLFSIMVPLTQATIAVLALYYAVYHWNSWFNALLFLREKRLFPLQLILREVLVQNDTSAMTTGADDVGLLGETVKFATIVVATIPILGVYPFLQRYFVKGVMIGAVKG